MTSPTCCKSFHCPDTDRHRGSSHAGAQAQGKLEPQLRLPVLGQELQLVRQAMYTEPEDQSAWMYHRWLLGMLLPHLHSRQEVLLFDCSC